MSKKVLVGLLFGVGVISSSFAQEYVVKEQLEDNCEAQQQQIFDKHLNAFFTKVDTDKDGKVSRIEFLDEASKKFDEMDLNNNGILTAEEVRQYVRAKIEKLYKEQGISYEKNRKNHHKRSDKKYFGDGKVSKAEYLSNFVGLFDKRDLNSDGYLTSEEVQKFYQQKFEKNNNTQK